MSAQNKINKSPKIAPYQHPLWNALGWVFSYFVATCVGLVIFYISCDDIGELFGAKDSLWTIENCTKVAIGIFALFAFVVTIWRGNLHAHQVSGQMDQIKLGREQLEKTEDNNIAKLLVDGTKLLGNGTSEAEKIAGIACLSYIIDEKFSFARQATDVLIDFIEKKAKDGDGFDMDEDGFYLQILDVVERHCKYTCTTVNVDNIYILGNNIHTINKFRWPSIKNITYSRFYFEDIFFNESISHFLTEECRFYQCSFDGAERMATPVYTEDVEVYNSETGDLFTYEKASYFAFTIFEYCIFGNSSISDTSFRRFDKKDEACYIMNDCYFDEAWISSSYAIDNLKKMDVMPFSMCPIDERPAIGPQKTT